MLLKHAPCRFQTHQWLLLWAIGVLQGQPSRAYIFCHTKNGLEVSTSLFLWFLTHFPSVNNYSASLTMMTSRWSLFIGCEVPCCVSECVWIHILLSYRSTLRPQSRVLVLPWLYLDSLYLYRVISRDRMFPNHSVVIYNAIVVVHVFMWCPISVKVYVGNGSRCGIPQVNLQTFLGHV